MIKKQLFIEPKDLQRFQWYVMLSKNRLRGFMLLFASFMILLNFFVRLFRMSSFNQEKIGSFAFFAVLALLVVVSIVSVIRSSYKQEDALGTIQILIHEKGVEYKTKSSETLLHWSKINGFYRTKRYLYVMTGTRRGIIIPRRDFASTEEEAAFINQVQEYYLESQKAPLVLLKRERGSFLSRAFLVFNYFLIISAVILIIIGMLNFLLTKK